MGLLGVLQPKGLDAQSPSFSHFTTSDGLAGNTVYCSTLDDQGYLWFGTDRGLSRFDGHYFENFGIEQGLPDPEVLELFPDQYGRLWVSCFRKNLIYRHQGKIYTEKNDTLLQQIQFATSIINIYEDLGKCLWITGKANAYYFVNQLGLTQKASKSLIYRIFRIGDQLFAFASEGLFLIQPNGVAKDSLCADQDAQWAIKNIGGISSLVVFGNNLLVSGRKTYLFTYQNGCMALRDSCNHSGRLYQDSRGFIWIASNEKGCYRFPQNSRKIAQIEHFFVDKRVNTIVEDGQGGIWLGTIGNGLYYFVPGQAASLDKGDNLPNLNFTSVRALPNGAIVAGNDFSQIYTWSSLDKKATLLDDNAIPNQCRSILAYSDNKLVVGTDKYISFIEHGKIQRDVTLNAIKVMHFQGDSLFVGTANSLYVLHGNKRQHIRHVNRTAAICQDYQGYLWAGGINSLLCQAQDFRVNWGDSFNLLQTRILYMERGPDDCIWLATTIHGLLKVQVRNGKVLQVIPYQHFFSEQFLIQTMLYEPANKNLWLGTNKGVFRLNAANNVRFFGKNEGLATLEVNGMAIRNDTIWAATTTGISVIPITPDLDYTQYRVEPVFAAYWDGGKQVYMGLRDSVRQTILFPHDAQLASVKFSVIDYAKRLGANFHCAVYNQLPHWYDITMRNLMDFLYASLNWGTPIQLTANNGLLEMGLHLPAGKYQIHCSASPNGSLQQLQAMEIIVQKKPFWYETLWFWILLIGTISAAFWFHWKNLRKIKRIQGQLTEIRLQAIQAQINPHFIGNSIQAIQQFFYPPNAVKASAYISALSRLLRRTIEFTDRQFVPIGDEIQFNRDYLELVKLRLVDRFNYEITLEGGLSPNHPFPTMLLQPLVENATTHGISENKLSCVRVKINKEADTMVCRVYDNGAGISETQCRQRSAPSDHISRGLKLVQRKISTLNSLYPCQIEFFIADHKSDDGQILGTVATINCSLRDDAHQHLLNYEND